MITFALSNAKNPHKVVVWCEPISGYASDNGERFRIIGTEREGIFKNNLVTIEITPGEEYPIKTAALKVWEGEVPGEFAVDRMKAVAWIEEQINDDITKFI